MTGYLTVSVNPPPLDVKIIVKKDINSEFSFDDSAKIMTLDSKLAKLDEHIMNLIVDKLTLWRIV